MESNDPILEVLYRLNVNKEIELNLLSDAMYKILKMENSDRRNVLLGSILMGLMVKNPKIEELVVLFETAFSFDDIEPYNYLKKEIKLPKGKNLIGTVGSGKKGIKTINISTASAIVASCLDVYIAKPCSSSVSSKTGSSDFLSLIGINLKKSLDETEKIIQNTKFGAYKIEKYLPIFGSLYNNKLFAPHVLSFALAALANPVKVDKLLYGISHPDIEKSVYVLNRFGFDNVLVISCTHDNLHYIDEFGIYGKTKIMGIKDHKFGKPKYFQPTEILGLPKYTYEDIKQGKTRQENIQYVIDAFTGKGKPAIIDIISINASALLHLDNKAEKFVDGFYLAKEALLAGKPIEKIREIIKASDGDEDKFNDFLR